MKRQSTQHNRISATARIEARVKSFGVALRGGLGWVGFTASFNERPGTSAAICPTHPSAKVFDSKWLQGEAGRNDMRANYRLNSLADSLNNDF
jgi:hypothetical protein